jgi:hypothetical protein
MKEGHMAQKKKFQSLLKETEVAGRVVVPKKAAAARQTYNTELDMKDKVELIDEIIETRSAELIRAYRDLIQISFGYRQRYSHKTKRIHISRQPCIVFLVKHKWSTRKVKKADQALPRYLYAYWSIDGKRKLCAVPTDVVTAKNMANIRPQTRTGVVIDPQIKNHKWGTGTITCAIHREGSVTPDKVFVLSCQHVFNMSGKINRSIVGTRVCLHDATFDRTIARTRAVRGEFRQAQQTASGEFTDLSFDAQLAEVVNQTNLQPAMKGLEIKGVAQGVLDLPEGNCKIYTSRRIIPARILHTSQFYALTYGSVTVRHKNVIMLRPSEQTIGGDSGSPILNPVSGKLIGMLIAGNGDTETNPIHLMAVMIPAWQLFDRKNYKNTRSGEKWVLVCERGYHIRDVHLKVPVSQFQIARIYLKGGIL